MKLRNDEYLLMKLLIVTIMLVISACSKNEKSSFTILLGNSSTALNLSLTVLPRYANASNWATFVRRADYITACDGTESGDAPCEHGGDKKQVVITGINSCSGLSLIDQLGAFNWYCDATSGTAIFYSALKQDMGLKHLLTAAGWSDNRVSLTYAGKTYYSSYGAWWTNPIEEAYDNSVSCIDGTTFDCIGDIVELNSSGRIYVVSNTRDTKSYRITNSNVSFTTLPGIALKQIYVHTIYNCAGGAGADDAFCTVNVRNTNRVYVEASMQFSANSTRNPRPTAGGSLTFPLMIYGTKLSVFRLMEINQSNDDAVYINDSASNYFSYMKISNAPWGLWVSRSVLNSNYNRFQNLLITGANDTGVWLEDTTGTKLINTSIIEGNLGVELENGRPNVGTVIHNYLSFSNEYGGLRFQDASDLTVSQIATFKAPAGGGVGVGLTNVVTSRFTGNFVFGDTTQNCFLFAGVGPFSTGAACTITEPATTDANVVTGLTGLTTSFVGPVTNDDANTNEDVLGQITGTATSYGLDWMDLDNFFRYWGPTTAYPGYLPCAAAATCQLTDASLELGVEVIRNTSDTGSSSNGVGFIIGAACPSVVHGNIVLTHQDTVTTYMKNAVEIDGRGDGDGLCESNETCQYTPNFGAYQGHDNFGQCIFTDGTITGVKMFGYSINGR
jgi:hypothetical protein